jgi:hypothetical protein
VGCEGRIAAGASLLNGCDNAATAALLAQTLRVQTKKGEGKGKEYVLMCFCEKQVFLQETHKDMLFF